MKSAIKKIAAVAMAFTLIGTGTAVTKTIAPQFDTSITAKAHYVDPTMCCHETATRSSSYNASVPVFVGNELQYKYVPNGTDKYGRPISKVETYLAPKYEYHNVPYETTEVYCKKCGQVFSSNSHPKAI